MAMQRRTKAAAESWTLVGIAALILVALNALSYFMYWRKDTTQNEKYTLSEGSGRLLRSMKGDMKVEAYVTRGLPKLDSFVRDLRDLLQQYKDSSKGKFDYVIIEAKDDAQKAKAKEAGLVEMPFGHQGANEDKIELAKGYMGLVINYGSERDAIKQLSPDNNTGLEFWITNKIREVRDKGDSIKHKIGVLAGHDEIKLSEPNLLPSNAGKATMQGIISQYFPFYTFVDVDLKNGDNEVDDTLDGLLVTQPGKDISDKELRRIDAFLMKGKSLAVIASAVNLKANDASGNATLSTHGIEKLLEGYGIVMKKDVVLDYGRTFRVSAWTAAGPQTFRFPPVLDVHDDYRFTGNDMLLDTSFPAFFRIPQVPFPYASSLELKRDKQPDIGPEKFRVLARSTPRTQVREGDTVDLKLLKQWAPQKSEAGFKQYDIAATIEGNLKSAFAGGDKMGVEIPEKAAQPARVLVISSSHFFTNPFARAGNGPDMGQMGMMMPGAGGDEALQQIGQAYAQQILTNTILVLKNTLDWVTGDVDLLAASAKIIQEPGLAFGDVSKPNFDMTEEEAKKEEERMKKERADKQNWIGWSLTLGIPILFMLLGLGLWWRRDQQRNNVALA